jgi:hypothetical protein
LKKEAKTFTSCALVTEIDAQPSPPAGWRRYVAPRRIFYGVLLVLGCGAFATLVFSKIDVADLRVGQITPQTPLYPAGALPYALPHTVLLIHTRTHITGCAEAEGDVQVGTFTERLHNEVLRGVSSVTVTAFTEVDPDQQYYLYFDSGSRSKTLDYAIETYENGTLKALTASLKDQVAPIAAAALGGVAGFAAAVATPHGAGRQPPQNPNCGNLTAMIAQNPDDPRLTMVQDDRWVPSSSDLSLTVAAPLNRLKTQFGLLAPIWARPNGVVSVTPPPNIAASSAIVFDGPKCSGDPDSCPAGIPPLTKGLVLREAVWAAVQTRVCDAACDQTPMAGLLGTQDDLSAAGNTQTVFSQFGPRFLVPLHSGFAQDASVDVALSAEGLITRLRLQSSSALAGSIKEVSGPLNGFAAGAGGK